ncbi:hypothetical protein [Nostoc sp. CALU 1950]|uniref:hypothetical protein n=1 Tax=Nostoc sp. CALU 1950 TaxID=3104321 RepID=UPI003EB8C9C9
MLNKHFLASFLALITAMTIIMVNVPSTYGNSNSNVQTYVNSGTNVQKIALRPDELIEIALDNAENFLEVLKWAYDNQGLPQDIMDTASEWIKNLNTAINSIKEKFNTNSRVEQFDIDQLSEYLQETRILEQYKKAQQMREFKALALEALKDYNQ